MALIDVTELLTDPDFVDEVQRERRVQSVTSKGRLAFTSAFDTIVASVQAAAPGDVLARFPDAGNPDAWVRVYTMTPLTAFDEAAGLYGDVLTWRGSRYQVRTTDDWLNYGAGYVKALARLIPAGAA